MYRLKRRSDAAAYAEVLTNPFNVTNSARIPDFNSYATNTFTDSKEYTFGVNAAGIGGTALLVTPASAVYWTEAAGTLDNNFAYGNGVALNGYLTQLTLYRAVRVVGLGVKVEFIGNDQNNQGLITATFCPSGNWITSEGDIQTNPGLAANPNTGFLTYGGGTGGSQTNLENSPYNMSTAAKNSLNMTWVPMDPRDLNFASPDAGGMSSIIGTVLGTPSGTTNSLWPYRGGFTIHVTGCDTNAKFRVSIQGHYEGITRSDSGLDAEISVNDPGGLGEALNKAQFESRIKVKSAPGTFATRTTGSRSVNLSSGTSFSPGDTIMGPPTVVRQSKRVRYGASPMYSTLSKYDSFHNSLN